jgi:DNA-binding CsgD family transcriptional regulator
VERQPKLLRSHALVQATAKDYMRHSQEQLIARPLLKRLVGAYGDADWLEKRLLMLLASWREQPRSVQGYGPGNVVNLLRLLRGELRGLDLSRLAIRQAYLAEVDAQDARLVDAELADTILAEAFHFSGPVALSSDGALLAAGTSTGQVGLWRVADRTSLWAVQGHTGGAWGVALSGDGRLAVSGGGDGTVRLWEAGSGRPLATLHGHTGVVFGVALDTDGRLAASGGDDGKVKLWEAKSGACLRTLRAERRQLCTMEQQLAYVRLLLAQGRLVEARRLLARLEQFVSERGLYRWLITIHLLLALVAERTRDHRVAHDQVAEALRIAAPESYVRAFLDEDRRVCALLRGVRHFAPQFVDHVLAHAGTAEALPQEKRPFLVEPLSARELEVLRLIAAGLSNPDIAQELVIRIGTVKRHINNIYGKLDAQGRTQAIAKARVLRLLDRDT